MKLTDTYEVWHNLNKPFAPNSTEVLSAFPDGFVHVADVEAEHLDEVFDKTNAVYRPWHENPGVTLVGPPTRSTAVGDVIVKALAVGADKDGAPVWLRASVELMGFRTF